MTPPTSRNSSIGVYEKISTLPIAVAEPVFSKTHQASAMRYRLSPSLESACPPQSRANERCLSDLSKIISQSFETRFFGSVDEEPSGTSGFAGTRARSRVLER